MELLAVRSARVQISFWGYTGSLGAQYVQYVATDRVSSPPDYASFYSERLLLMPKGFTYLVTDHKYSRREVFNTSIVWPSRSDHGLPEHGVVFACFNQARKLDPDIWSVWMRILANVPGSVLWLLEFDSRPVGRLRMEASRAGIAPSRIVFSRLFHS